MNTRWPTLDEILFLYILEVFVGADFEFVAGSFVGDDDGGGVEVEGADGPHLVDSLFDAVLQCASFIVAVHKDQNLFGIHYSTDTDSQSSLRNLGDIIVEEAAICDDGVGGKSFLAGAAAQA